MSTDRPEWSLSASKHRCEQDSRTHHPSWPSPGPLRRSCGDSCVRPSVPTLEAKVQRGGKDNLRDRGHLSNGAKVANK